MVKFYVYFEKILNKLLVFSILVLILGFYLNDAFADNYEIIIPSGSNAENCDGNLCFDPISITIKQGDTITWVNQDDKLGTDGGPAAHQLSSKTGQDTQLLTMGFGETKSFQFSELGKTEYHCIFHPWMIGEIIVEERPLPYEIRDNSTGGDCNKIGNWDSTSRICKISKDIDSILIIRSNNLELNGNGYKLNGNPIQIQSNINGCIIADTKTDLVIKNFEIFDCGYGIHFTNVQNSKIINNKIHNTFQSAIHIYQSNNNEISDNEIYDNHSGIILSSGNEDIIKNNTIKDNFFKIIGTQKSYGIFMSKYVNSAVESNFVEGHEIGILIESKNKNSISSNIIQNNKRGIDAGRSELIEIINNEISQSEYGLLSSSPKGDKNIGGKLLLQGNTFSENFRAGYIISNYNKINENSFISNEIGLSLGYPSDNISTTGNKIFNNNFIDNYKQVEDGTGNYFTVDNLGNYWSDFSSICDDLDDDKICDEPYPFSSGTIGVNDNAVWKEQDGWVKSTSISVMTTEKETSKTLESISEQDFTQEKLGIASFVDQSKDPQYYIDRYNKEPAYKEWFHKNYPQYDSIEQAVGLELTEKVPDWVKNIFGWYANDQVSEDELLNAIRYLINQGILVVN